MALQGRAKSAERLADVVSFSCSDFAGGSLRHLFTAPANLATKRLTARFTGANVLTAVMDGLRVKRFLQERLRKGFFDHRDAMRKKPGKRISSFRVEVPIARALLGAPIAAEQRDANVPKRNRAVLAWAEEGGSGRN